MNEVSYGCCYFVTFRWIGDICLSSPVICGIAKKAHKYDRNCVLNILVGWSFIGWVAALVWALVNSGDKK